MTTPSLHILCHPVDYLDLSVRATCALQRRGIAVIWQLCASTPTDLLKRTAPTRWDGFPRKCIAEIEEALSEHGLTLGMGDHPFIKWIRL